MKIIKTIPSLPKRRPDTHKGDYGKVLVVAGSRGMTGAAALCSEAALRSGAGLVYLATPASQQPILAVKLTETITYALPETADGTLSSKALKQIIALTQGTNVAAIGPGISRNAQTVGLVNSLLPHIHCPVIIDADGLNAISTSGRTVIKKQKAEMILTPHSGEMARLLKTSPTRIEANRIDSAIEASKRFNAIIALKG
ncbi:MAG: NAD(P)H-hydrate dehydratase [Planctomycetes bacterium]|nr:NAD(P)H-hydrate dehydratase [Planctomycetota bacterium]